MSLKKIAVLNHFPGQEIIAGDGLSSYRFPGYLFFLPNYTEYVYGPEFYIGQTWSLGVEEFFYLFFPIGLYFVRKEKVMTYLLVVTSLFFILSAGAYFFHRAQPVPTDLQSILYVFFDKYRIYAFGCGGIVALLLLQPGSAIATRLSRVQKKRITRVLLALLSVLVTAGITFSFLTQQVYAVLISLFIYTMVSSGMQFSFLNNRIMVYLGKISYGIYMLHPLALVLVFKLTGDVKDASPVTKVLLVVSGILLTILLATISFELFEKFFLRRKKVNPVTEL